MSSRESSTLIRRASLYLLAALIVFGAWEHQQRALDQARPPRPVAVPFPFPEGANTLQPPAGDGPGVEIALNDPVELDGMSREQVDRLRKDSVGQYGDLVAGEYRPLEAVFGPIVDGKPWWGTAGQFCHANGEKSIDGPSEESRFIANPFCLLFLDLTLAHRLSGRDCLPAYPRPQRLFWSQERAHAYLTFDLSRFFREREELRLPTWSTVFSLDNINARDFGYNFLHIDPQRSFGVQPLAEGGVFQRPYVLRGLIHLGSSCGYPGGCNNGSPDQPELHLTFTELPARLVCLLWKRPPQDINQPADFEFVIEAF